jgi:hypothetical protein
MRLSAAQEEKSPRPISGAASMLGTASAGIPDRTVEFNSKVRLSLAEQLPMFMAVNGF